MPAEEDRQRPPPPTAAELKQQRLAEALRRNLKRRKALKPGSREEGS